ncbi:acetylpolyamine aminohydrolase [candidate division MSBL1 archaeon SCGC-AAA382M17]|uniref:Acetylpolyamine aminohydrolase n=1 Tax=candidate division MSBL1 archaeon SCGC-AAA382M17 TaxID=1698284 RepID=A0ABR5TJJ9_9EURY|nr:acetylpolyamine aminohydrolase [candidate division MSBL1 archaeon SCGC-AAA382M17]
MKKNELFEIASLSAGGAIEAGKIAYDKEPSFGLIRPPGHHAPPNSSWGFCYFNNMAIALEKLKEEGKIEGAYILDFDLHTGDGNINALGGNQKMEILNPRLEDREAYLEEISNNLEEADQYDIIGVSAGFDEHVDDWGGKLTTSDYREIGYMVKKFSEEKCKGRRFAILEGGYNQDVLGMNASSFVKGFID